MSKLLNDNPDLPQRIAKLRAGSNGMPLSFREISELLNEEGINVSHMTVKRLLENSQDTALAYTQGHAIAKEKAQEEFLDTVNQMKGINKKTWDIIEHLEESGDMKTSLFAIKEVREQLKLQNEILKKISPTGNQTMNVKEQTVNIVNMSVNIRKIMTRLEERGYIKILKEVPEAVPV